MPTSTAMDGATDGLPFDPTKRIPPIQDPSTVHVISNHRPSPLEPSAAEGHRPNAVRLSSRSKALANALPIGSGGTPIKPLDTSHLSSSGTQPEDREKLVSRKRHHVDYVQLPQPRKRGSADRSTTIESVPRLNQLHEPPPSAARFPPITTSGASPHLQRSGLPQLAKSPSIEQAAHGVAPRHKGSDGADQSGEQVPKKPKRVYTRGRRNWTEEETDSLLRGVAKYGVGKWKRIMEDPEFEFPPDRTPVDLKDRYRTCKLHEERRIERLANGETSPDRNVSGRRSSKPSTDEPTARLSFKAGQASPTSPARSDANPQETPNSVISFAAVSTIHDVAKTLESTSKKESRRWTSEEDANLSKGFQKYGFSWTSIAKDKGLQLQHRTGTQLRDRFRVKFPIHYQSSVPAELPDSGVGKNRNRKRESKTADPKGPRGGIKVLLATPDKPKGKSMDLGAGVPAEQRSKTLTIADMTESPTEAQSASRPLLPSMSSLCAQVYAQPIPDHAGYGALDIQPLPDSEEDYEDDSDYEEMDSERGFADEDHEMGGLSDDVDDDAALDRGGITTGGGSGGAGGGHDVRHMSISGLLNETQQENAVRLPPFRSAYDDTNELSDTAGVHLPRLTLWDDLAPKPMFDLD